MTEVTIALRPIKRRRYAPKTRAGCVTCKIRRVKCDQRKPSCERCTSTGRKCDGYGEIKPAVERASPTSSIDPALTIDVSSDFLEKRTFDFFRCNTVPGITGYFRDDTWDRTVLQVSHSEPAVRYAVNALGALHEEIALRRKSRQEGLSVAVDCRTSFPLKQYTKAIKEVQKLLQTEDVSLDVILLCSLAFMHFEALHESFLPALLHLENAIRLLKSRSVVSGKAVDHGIVQAIRRMDVQGSTYLGLRVPGLPYYNDEVDLSLPSSFRNLSHARDIVDTWTCRLLYFLRTEADDYKFRWPGSLPLELIAKAQEFERSCTKIDNLLKDFAQKMVIHLSRREQHGLDILRSRAKINRMTAAVCLYSEASAMDAFQADFEEILMLSNYTMYGQDLDSSLFSASLDEGLLSPLFFVAINCRDSRTRHKALELLQALPARQGIWYMEVMTSLAAVSIKYEEALCKKEHPGCEDIPEWRRVHGSGLSSWDVSVPKTEVKAHLRTRPNGMDGDWCDVQESIYFLTTTSPKDLREFYTQGMPALSSAYPFTDYSQPLRATVKWALHTEPFMSTIPDLTTEPAIP